MIAKGKKCDLMMLVNTEDIRNNAANLPHKTEGKLQCQFILSNGFFNYM